jgi:hypothetical protein
LIILRVGITCVCHYTWLPLKSFPSLSKYFNSKHLELNLLRHLPWGEKQPSQSPGNPKIIPQGNTYIKEERVIHCERELNVAQVPRAVAEVLHTGGAHFFGICRAQG